ncbi:unnamed protein product [Lampetra fluviatilis]
MAGFRHCLVIPCLLSILSVLYVYIKQPDFVHVTIYSRGALRARGQGQQLEPPTSLPPRVTDEPTTPPASSTPLATTAPAGWTCPGPVTVANSKNESTVLNLCDHHLPVFLNPYNLSSAKYNQFENISYNLPFGICNVEKKVKLVLDLTKNYSLPAQLQRFSNRSCVVVGNSFILKGRKIGSIIDSYDTVIRQVTINDAPTKGYEEDVGSRCTLRVVYPMTATKDQQARDQNDTIALFVPFKAADIDWILRVVRGVVAPMKTGAFKWDVPPHNVRILNPVFMRVASLELLNNLVPTRTRRALIPTTGFLTVTAALHMCREVHIAGFGYPKATKNVGNQLVHYYGEGRMRQITRARNHDVNPEGFVLRNMIASGLIQNLTPS